MFTVNSIACESDKYTNDNAFKSFQILLLNYERNWSKTNMVIKICLHGFHLIVKTVYNHKYSQNA